MAIVYYILTKHQNYNSIQRVKFMNILNKIKDYLVNKNSDTQENDNNKLIEKDESIGFLYDQIIDEFEKLKSNSQQIKDLKKSGYVPPIVTEVENKVLELIDEDESVLTWVENFWGKNIGMMAAELGLEKVVLRALDNNEASIQTDCHGQNLGIYAARYDMETAVLKSMDNKDSVLQQDIDCCNIAMYAVCHNMKQAVAKALENKELMLQQDRHGFNFGHICVRSGGYEDMYPQLFKDVLFRNQRSIYGGAMVNELSLFTNSNDFYWELCEKDGFLGISDFDSAKEFYQKQIQGKGIDIFEGDKFVDFYPPNKDITKTEQEIETEDFVS